MAGILDKVVSNVNKGVATVGANSKAMMERARVKTIISNLDTERRQLAELLGMKVYENHVESGESPEDACLANFIVEIGKRMEGIAEQQAELKRIDEAVSAVTGAKANPEGAEMRCTCGQEVYQGDKFCGTCGNPVQELVQETAQAPEMRCACGEAIYPEDKFCGTCGSPAQE